MLVKLPAVLMLMGALSTAPAKLEKVEPSQLPRVDGQLSISEKIVEIDRQESACRTSA